MNNTPIMWEYKDSLMRDDGIVIIIERHKGDGHYRVQEIHPEDTDIAQ